jgi:hypothetical protein
MKKILIVAMLVLVPVFFAQAETDVCPNCPMKAGQGIMNEGCSQQHMMKHKMMMRELMGMMKDTMKIQQGMITDASKAEKEEMTKKLSRMMERIDAMMSKTEHMMGKGMKCDKPCDGCKNMEKCGIAANE